MSPRVGSVLAIFLACLSLLHGSPALAQYMYLDSNGDGAHTIADAVNPSGPTTVDIWLDTAANRDGSPVVCDVDPSQLVTFFSYVTGLRATNGTISWGTFTNRQATFAFGFGQHKSSTEFEDGFGGPGVRLPPARYLLATLTLNVASGSPAIDIVPFVSVGSDFTGFGSHCEGIDRDNTLKLGTDWHDVDGLPFGSTGSPNQPPLLDQPQDMMIATGELAFQTLSASDPDHQPLTFSKVSGPGFATVTTRDVGTGTAAGLVALAPVASDLGISNTTVSVTDGLASAQKTFQVQVTAGPNHAPTLPNVGSLTVLAGTTPRALLNAVDSDGQPLVFEKLSGPDYMQVTTLTSGPGGAVGSLRLAPGICDLGTTPASLQVTDGVMAVSQELTITVKVPRAAAPQPPFLAAGRSTMVGAADLDGDGHLDLLSGGISEPLYTLLGHGDGTFAPPTTQSLGSNHEPTSVAFGDWDEDGRVDAAITLFASDHLAVLLGAPAGGLGAPVNYPTGGNSQTVRAADLDQDGHLDLVFTHNGGVGVMLGNGDGSFAPRTDYAAGSVPQGLAIADFNRDGRLDFAVVGKDLRIRLGLGHALFGDAVTIPLTNAFDIVAADWNGDGKADLAVSNNFLGTVRILIGDGNGAFTPGAELTGFDGFQRMEAADIDLDGNEDLVAAVSTVVDDTYVTYGNGDGTFRANRKILEADLGLATGDFNEDGFRDVVSNKSFAVGVPGECLRVWLNDSGGAGMPEARAFAESKGGGRPTTCVRLEPVAGSYRNAEVDPTSLTLSPEEGNGSVNAVTTKSAPVGDTDGNGIAEIPACFSRDDVAALFDTKNGRQTVTARVQGALVDGRQFCTRVSIDIIGTGKRLSASLSPNPLNPGGVLRLTTSRDGFVRVRMFDPQGRVVRVLEDRAMVPAGAHDVRIDGRNTAGQTLASGIYFYQVDTAEGSLKGRITVLK